MVYFGVVVVILVVVILVVVTGVKQSQLLVLRLGLEFDNTSNNLSSGILVVHISAFHNNIKNRLKDVLKK